MIKYHCDGCGVAIPEDALRYVVDIDVKAAYNTLQITLADLVRSHRDEFLALIERMKNKSAKELEESVYKKIRLDLCPACQRAYIRNPLRFHPEQSGPTPNVDIDQFLRSLGMDHKHDKDA